MGQADVPSNHEYTDTLPQWLAWRFGSHTTGSSVVWREKAAAAWRVSWEMVGPYDDDWRPTAVTPSPVLASRL